MAADELSQDYANYITNNNVSTEVIKFIEINLQFIDIFTF